MLVTYLVPIDFWPVCWILHKVFQLSEHFLSLFVIRQILRNELSYLLQLVLSFLVLLFENELATLQIKKLSATILAAPIFQVFLTKASLRP